MMQEGGGSGEEQESATAGHLATESAKSNGDVGGQEGVEQVDGEDEQEAEEEGGDRRARLGPAPAPLTGEEIVLIDETIAELLEATKARNVDEVRHKLGADTVKHVSRRVEAFFLHEPSLLSLKAPINIVGDVHGQFLDLLRYLEAGGLPPESQYLFLGDYIDRGRMGMEVSILLFCFKLRYPDRVFLLRGNHECSQISRMYGFYEECKAKYDTDCWKALNQVFRCLPLAAIVNDRIFATHGGLSPDLRSLEDIDRIQRPCDVPSDGLLCDLLWSDPSPHISTWEMSDRGVSYIFGEEALDKFIQTYDFDLFVRAHQVVEEGFEFFKNSRKLVTVFSAANYCASFDNAGAMLIVDEDLVCSFHVIKPPLAKSNDIHDANDKKGSSSILGNSRPQTPRPD